VLLCWIDNIVHENLYLIHPFDNYVTNLSLAKLYAWSKLDAGVKSSATFLGQKLEKLI
jgi:hypothetical protein